MTRPSTPVDKMMSSIFEPLASVTKVESSNTSCQCGVSFHQTASEVSPTIELLVSIIGLKPQTTRMLELVAKCSH